MIQSVLARRLVYPLHERLLKRPTFPYLAELEHSQWLSRAGMRTAAGEETGQLAEIGLRTLSLAPGKNEHSRYRSGWSCVA